MNWHDFQRPQNISSVLWAILLCGGIVAMTAALGRATINLSAAVIEKPDIAIYLLLPDAGIGETTLLRSTDTEREYLAETRDGPKLIRMKMGEKGWYIVETQNFHEK